MIQVHRNSSTAYDVRIKVVGLGGAGGNVLDRLLLDGLHNAELIAINTDAQALTASVVEQKVQIGRTTTRGLGAGGDPELGYAAAEEGVEEIRNAIEGAQLVFLCVGLGGGTGSGAARIVASLAREQKALVVAFATLPFAFEGRRRRAQADEALAALQRYSDVVIHFENDRMGDAVAPLAGIHEAFATADQTVSQSIRAIIRLMHQRGLVHIGFDEIVTALRGSGEAGAHCVFGFGEADGDNRAHEALTRALKNPLMDKGRMLEDARNILVNVAGGPSTTLNEVQILMEELNRHISDQTRLLFGAAVDPALGQKISVTILSALQGAPAAAVPVAPRPAARVESAPVSVTPAPAPAAPVSLAPVREPVVIERTPEPVAPVEPAIAARIVEPPVTTRIPEPVVVERTHEPVVAERIPEPEIIEHIPEPEPEPVPRRVSRVRPVREPESEPEPVYVDTATRAPHMPTPVAAEAAPLYTEPAPAPASEHARGPKQPKPKPTLAKQEQMQFEPVTRGRFEKSEPTIVDGQDLDVPTFLRRNVKVK
ncbi:cell division protein FtsZ [Chthoniobacter flavus Ellin428]|uniref:Cell division protein FtsZ n=1 Tax=Chthoniobacter flavus Ellin428 TaxID=497964 RepID=B4D1Y9_9BACT|nr:cell division protein FtsZ [Chthoniobacter flavus]EDY19751.1 cell division protein FtsZ [Chthoniobacter flavus Ellin428]TCO92986.1 cell division protein FtsZ [Chthoniobacter flavus]